MSRNIRSIPRMASTVNRVRPGLLLVVRGDDVIGCITGDYGIGFTAQRVVDNVGVPLGRFAMRDDAQQAVERAHDEATLEELAVQVSA